MAPQKRALITGASGQLGRFLVPLLLERNYLVETTTRQAPYLPPGPFDEVYLLHITRPRVDPGLSGALRNGILSVAEVLECYTSARVLVPDSHAALRGGGPPSWVEDKRLTRALAAQHVDRLVMPTLGQYISKWGNPERMYLMEVLHQIGRGEDPRPRDPSALICPAHARDGALLLWKGMNGDWSGPWPQEEMSVARFIELARTPGHWIESVVEELK